MIVVLFSLTHRQRSYVHEKNMLGMLRLVSISISPVLACLGLVLLISCRRRNRRVAKVARCAAYLQLDALLAQRHIVLNTPHNPPSSSGLLAPFPLAFPTNRLTANATVVARHETRWLLALLARFVVRALQTFKAIEALPVPAQHAHVRMINLGVLWALLICRGPVLDG